MCIRDRNTMIHSFRGATDDWLSQRLVADLYLRGQFETSELERWLAMEMPDLKLSGRYRETGTYNRPAGKPVLVEIVNLREGERFRDSVTLMRAVANATARFESGDGIY